MLELLIIAVFLQSVALVVLVMLLSATGLRLLRHADQVEQQRSAIAEMKRDLATIDEVLLSLGKVIHGR